MEKAILVIFKNGLFKDDSNTDEDDITGNEDNSTGDEDDSNTDEDDNTGGEDDSTSDEDDFTSDENYRTSDEDNSTGAGVEYKPGARSAIIASGRKRPFPHRCDKGLSRILRVVNKTRPGK